MVQHMVGVSVFSINRTFFILIVLSPLSVSHGVTGNTRSSYFLYLLIHCAVYIHFNIDVYTYSTHVKSTNP